MRHYFSGFRRSCLATVLSLFFLPAQASPFDQGSLGVTVLVGSGQAFNENYTIVGAGIGYYVIDGLRLGLDAETWLGGSIDINKVSPQVQYVYTGAQEMKPYAGAFFRRASIEGLDNLDSAGARAGVYLSSRGGFYISIGVVREEYLDCDETVYISCSDTYPEITLTISL
jgi:hypothetical protein